MLRTRKRLRERRRVRITQSQTHKALTSATSSSRFSASPASLGGHQVSIADKKKSTFWGAPSENTGSRASTEGCGVPVAPASSCLCSVRQQWMYSGGRSDQQAGREKTLPRCNTPPLTEAARVRCAKLVTQARRRSRCACNPSKSPEMRSRIRR